MSIGMSGNDLLATFGGDVLLQLLVAMSLANVWLGMSGGDNWWRCLLATFGDNVWWGHLMTWMMMCLKT